MQFDMGSGFIYSPEDGAIFYQNTEIITISGIRQGILRLLLEKTGDFVTREDIVKTVWGKDDTSTFNASLTQQIYLLRKDLAKAGLAGKIISHQHEGYKLLITHTPKPQSEKSSNKFNYFTKTIMHAFILINFFVSLYLFFKTS